MKLTLTPAELIDQLRAWFHPKDRSLYIANNLYVYSQALAWQNAISTFQNLPGLVGFWPMSSIQRSTGNAYDLSGQARTLTYNGNPAYNYTATGAPYIDLDGTGDYLSRADETDLDIQGTETIYAATVRGLTMGGWFWFNGPAVNQEVLISKSQLGTAATTAYWLNRQNTGELRGLFSDGVNFYPAISTTVIPARVWTFCMASFIPNTSVSVVVNSEKTTAGAAPASLQNNANPFNISGYNNGTGLLLTGRASLCFLCANALGDANALFQQTRSLFGV